jgi:alkylation response protein AidB-like acyl-CoA dehydrogenase
MTHYKSNLRDIEFNLFEVFNTQASLGQGTYAEIDEETARSILTEVDRLAREDLAASYVAADREPPIFDPHTHTAPLSEAIKNSYQAWMDAEYWRLLIPEALGGTPAPASLSWSLAELVLGANAPIWMYASGPSFAATIYDNGTKRDQQIAQHIVDQGWSTTMVLTEPDAGSDVGAGRTKATPNDDGSWNISGVKRFITSGEHDLTKNIVHLVLARPQGVAGVGGPGTKGLSLFIVPKWHFDQETGELTGARNGVYATGLEHKMGIRVSNTCELTFGDPNIGGGEPAVGWLLGEVHDGIAQMFQVIENARMMVGTKAIATLSTGYLNALEYAKERVQGPDLTHAADKTAPRVHITAHPDVRRSLMLQKAYAEGLRALVTYTATWQDHIYQGRASGESDPLAESVNDLLLPLVKGCGSERSWQLLGTESLQTFGGSGFLQEYPLEQYVRDAKIDTLYEGTTAIQGLDFFFRKIVKDGGKAIRHLAQQIGTFAAGDAGNGRLKVERGLLGVALEETNALLALMMADLESSNVASGGEARNVYKVGLNTSRLLMAVGDLVVGWLLLRQAEIALNKLASEVSEADQVFYQGKVVAASFFAKNVLTRIPADRAAAEHADLDLMDLPEAAF